MWSYAQRRKNKRILEMKAQIEMLITSTGLKTAVNNIWQNNLAVWWIEQAGAKML
jgi:hypothetical protein